MSGDRVPRLPSLVSVVLPTRNAAATVLDQLRALSEQTYRRDWELIVVDNGSEDETVQIVAAAARALALPTTRVVQATGRGSASHARNAGAREARGEFLAMCDADDVATPEWLEALVTAGARADLVGGWLNTEPLNDRVSRSWRSSYPRDHLPEKAGYLPYVQAADLGVWRDVFVDLGGFAADLEAGEDIDFCWRAQLAGYHLAFAPSAEIWYRHREGLAGLWKQFRAYGRADVELALRFRGNGLSTSRVVLLRRAAWLLMRSPYVLCGRRRRGIWIRVTAQLSGNIQRGLARRYLVGLN